jgi:ABC-type multidrug transport system fused ATPase/permease subunit
MLVASSYPILNFFWTMLEFFVLFLWIFILIQIIFDIFRSHDIGGGMKAFWLFFIIILPFLGVLIYLIARGGSMHERQLQQAQAQQQAFDSYVKETAGTASTADELAKLADLKAKGTLSDAEYEAAKAKLLS